MSVLGACGSFRWPIFFWALGPAPPHSLLKKMRFVVFRKSDYTLPAKVALEAPVTTHAPLGPLPRPLLRTCAAEEVVLELLAQHARQLRHTASPLALRLAPVAGAAGGCQQGGRQVDLL